ncbi:MAG: radical SAM family heme chaperone HemW, partial [Endomicrobiaceae bacterium]|nr:radical SAM family heme chaperone HemW [Endomicrobiaceae bacterium]
MTGLYIHIPFCKRKCFYCDFISFNYNEHKADDYIKALFKESRKYKKEKISTVYVGGGTPSILSSNQIKTLIDGIKKNFDVTDIEEFTVELNPESATVEKLELLYDNKISRISFGLQSSNNEELKILGRLHNYNDFLTAYTTARDIGFDNISVDLMYGIETQSVESWQKTLVNILNLNPDHISLYPLTIEKNTPYHDQNKKVDYDLQSIMYNAACEKLKDSVFTHYEISNWAKDGKFS